MTEPTLPPPPRRSNADYRWSRLKIIAFLKALPATLSVTEAARSVGMSRQSAYRLRARLGPGFGEVWDDGLALGLTLRRSGIAAAGGTAPQGDTPAFQADKLGGQADKPGAQADKSAARPVSSAAQGDSRPRPPVTFAETRVTLAARRVTFAPQVYAPSPESCAPAPQSYGRRT